VCPRPREVQSTDNEKRSRANAFSLRFFPNQEERGMIVSLDFRMQDRAVSGAGLLNCRRAELCHRYFRYPFIGI
jgi:hypothetical protein